MVAFCDKSVGVQKPQVLFSNILNIYACEDYAGGFNQEMGLQHILKGRD